jgi:hypothetical protein
MAQVVGILGFKGSGKDTVGEYLVKEHGFEVESFANPLKDLISAVFGWDRDLLEGNTTDSRTWRETPDEWWEAKLNWTENHGAYLGRFTPRAAMQFIGTDVMRKHFDDSLWIKSLEARLRGKSKVVVTDCRFPNECGLIRENQGLMIRVKRGPEPAWFDLAKVAASGAYESTLIMSEQNPTVHISEWAWLNEEAFLLENDRTIADLYEKTECLLNLHFSKH